MGLYQEIHIGNIEFVKEFVNKDNVNGGWDSRSYAYYPPLIIACLKGKLEIVKYLVSIGANINVIDSDNDTPLSIAKRYNFQEIVDYLQLVQRFKQ